MNPPRRGLYVVYVVTALTVCGGAIGLHLSVPIEVADYVSNGLMLPAFRYGLLFALIACGIVFSGECQPIVLIAHLAVLSAALWFGLFRAEAIIVSYERLAEFIAMYPVPTTAMGMTTGGALLLSLRARRWLIPVVAGVCGLGLGLFAILESPLDHFYGWFASAAGLGGMAVIVAAMALANVARRTCTGSWLGIAGRISGSWLIAASLLLAALAVVPKRSQDPEPIPNLLPDGIDLPRQP